MDGYTARDLCAEFGITIDTLQFYRKRGVVPSPTRGRHARWPPETWGRLDELRRASDRRRTLADWAEKFSSTS